MKILPQFLLGSLTAAWSLLAPGLRAQTASPTVLCLLPVPPGGGYSVAQGALIQDGSGNFYGTTQDGGAFNRGSVYKVTPAGDASTLYSFGGGTPGVTPSSAVLLGSDGFLYGTTETTNSDGTGYGTIYKLSSTGALTTLHVFNGTDGLRAEGSLVFGPDGKLYGTTYSGGANNTGTVYAITVDGAFTLLHSFVMGEGTAPHCALTLGRDGNFYGTTAYNGTSTSQTSGDGSVFKITPTGVFTTLHLFVGATDGSGSNAPLFQGSDGNFYGSAAYGGANGSGTVFRITPDGAFSVLHTFSVANAFPPVNSDGARSDAAFVDGGDGKLYGLTGSGGVNATGTVFSITLDGTLTTVYSFPAVNSDNANAVGAYPYAGFLKAADGKFYVPLPFGGTNGHGTVVAFTGIGSPSSFFADEIPLSNGVYYLSFSNGDYFGYYSYLTDSRYIYHFDLGYEYVFDANDGKSGVYFYDFKSNGFFYTSPSFPFPYLYDFSLNTVLYYYPDTANLGHYTANPRYFYNYSTDAIITK